MQSGVNVKVKPILKTVSTQHVLEEVAYTDADEHVAMESRARTSLNVRRPHTSI